MFRQSISSTPFVSEYADALFPKIKGEHFQSDVSFLSTMRALLAPRMKDGDSVNLKFTQATFDTNEANHPKETIEAALAGTNIGKPGQFIICNLRGDKDSNSAIIKMIKKNFCKIYTTFREVNKIEEFYAQSFDCVGFNDPTNKSVVIFVSRMTLRILHYLQPSIAVIMPWMFNEGGPDLSEGEWALITPLCEKDTDDEGNPIDRQGEYMEAIGNLAKKYDFNKARITKLLDGYETRMKQNEINSIQANINNIDRSIENYNNEIMGKLRAREDYLIRLHGLKYGIDGEKGKNELLDYFLSNKSVYLESVNGDTIYFSVRTYLTYYNEDALKSILRNTRGPIQEFARDSSSRMSAEDMKRLLRATLLDHKIRMRFCAAYSFSVSSGVNAQRDHQYPEEFKTYMRNPHIDRHNCLGNYRTALAECMKKADYIGTIEQCVASAMSLNVLESASFDPMIKRLYDRNYQYRKCFELPDGKVVTPEDALAWLDKEEQNEKKKAKKADAAAKTEG